jgi:hypothetical protein
LLADVQGASVRASGLTSDFRSGNAQTRGAADADRGFGEQQSPKDLPWRSPTARQA